MHKAAFEEQYYKIQRTKIKKKGSKLSWWKENQSKYPSLATIARCFLAQPAKREPKKQLFSGAGIIYDPLRNRLSGQVAENLLLLKYNLPEVGFKC